jgi:hypothetical protein
MTELSRIVGHGLWRIVVVFALPLASGTLVALALPPRSWIALAWIGLVPVLVAGELSKRLAVRAFAGGLATGFAAALYLAMTSSTGSAASDAAVIGATAFAGAAWQAVTGGTRAAGLSSGANLILIGPLTATGLEWLAASAGAPVGLCLVASRTPSICQISAVAGRWGVSLAFYLVNGLIATAIVSARRRVRVTPLMYLTAAATVGVVATASLVPTPADPALDESQRLMVAAVEVQSASYFVGEYSVRVIEPSDGRESAWLLATVDGIDGAPAFSPNGGLIGITKRIPWRTIMLDRRRCRVLELPGLGQPSFSPTGAEFVAVSRDGLEIVDDVGRPNRILAHGAFESPSWSPDGSLVAAIQIQGGGHRAALVLLAVDSGRSRVVSEWETEFRGIAGGTSWSPDGRRLAFGKVQPGEDATYLFSGKSRAILELLLRLTQGVRDPPRQRMAPFFLLSCCELC